MEVRRRRSRITTRLLIAGALAGVFGLAGAAVTHSANQLSYEVMVADQSTTGRVPACKPTRLFVDRKTGAEIACAGTPEEGFTAAERQEILTESAKLAADGQVDGEDGFALTQLAATIGKRHDEAANSVLTILFLDIAALGGLTLIGGIIRKMLETRASRDHWRDWQKRLGR
jgi:hypothetical protein